MVFSMKTIFCISVIVTVFWGPITPMSWGATPWATGPVLQKMLAEPVDIVLVENPMRQALVSWSQNKNVAVLLDRRIDPGRKIEITLRQTPLKEAFEKIAQKYNLGISIVGPVVYFAPPETARTVRTLVALRREDVRRLAPTTAKKYIEQKSMSWDDLTTPRDLLEKLGRENGIQIAGMDQIPHDLWAAADLPPLELIERLTLIAGQYDLTFQVSADGNRITLLPVPERVELVRSYPAGRQAQATVKNYASLAPQARIHIDGDKIVVSGMIEDHERISTPQRPAERNTAKSADVDPAFKRYTLTIEEQPIGPLLEHLVPQLNLELKIDKKALEKAGISLDQRVSFSVKNVTVDELFRAALKQTGLKFIRRENIVQIVPLQEKVQDSAFER
jgi:Secretin and TonB N terminus short domain